MTFLSREDAARFRRERGLGHPLYVNGRLFEEPVTISHVPGPTGNYYSVPAGVGDVDPSMGALGSYAAYAPQLPPLGADPLPGADPRSLPPGAPATPTVSPIFRAWAYVAPISALACAYHGYKRNDSIGWALWWFLLGGIPLTPVIALAQGFGEKKSMTPNRRRNRRRRNTSNLRGAKNYVIGAGYTAESQLSADDRALLSRSYGVTEADYGKIFSRAATTRSREAKRASGRSPWQAIKRAVKRKRRR